MLSWLKRNDNTFDLIFDKYLLNDNTSDRYFNNC